MVDVAVVFAAGLLGSAHCVGMCGGFVALLGSDRDHGVVARQAAYFSGKTMVYAAQGALAGLLGVGIRDVLANPGGLVSVVVGSMMVLAGASVCGIAWSQNRLGAGLAARLAPVVRRLVRSRRPGTLVALGAVNGLLPCGLVYGTLAVAAASGSPVRGGMLMSVFGLATIPALVLTGLLAVRLRPSRRLALQRLAGALLIVVGLLTMMRGSHALVNGPAMSGHAAHAMIG